LIVEQTHDRMATVAIDLGRVGVVQIHHVASELDDGTLQAEADAEEGDAALTREANGLDLAGNAAIAEAAWHHHAVDAAQHALGAVALDLLRLDAPDRHPARQGDAGVIERFVDRFVRVLVLDVLADDRDADLVLRIDDALQNASPVADLQWLRAQVQ